MNLVFDSDFHLASVCRQLFPQMPKAPTMQQLMKHRGLETPKPKPKGIPTPPQLNRVQSAAFSDSFAVTINCSLHPHLKIKYFQRIAYPNVQGNITINGKTAQAHRWMKTVGGMCQDCWDHSKSLARG